MPRTHKAGGAEDPYGAPRSITAPQMVPLTFGRVCAAPELTEIHWTSLRAVAGACDKPFAPWWRADTVACCRAESG